MGTDIEGWVEARDVNLHELFDETLWLPLVRIGYLVERNYAMFGSLFGARSLAFRPIAPEAWHPSCRFRGGEERIYCQTLGVT